MKKKQMQHKIIVEHECSPFNKVPLIVKLTEDGHASLTKDSLTIAKNGKKRKKKLQMGNIKPFTFKIRNYIIIFQALPFSKAFNFQQGFFAICCIS